MNEKTTRRGIGKHSNVPLGERTWWVQRFFPGSRASRAWSWLLCI